MMRLLRRARHWWRFRAHRAELDEELAFHRDAIAHDLVRRGHAPADARDAARRAMGNETLMREEARGIWLWPALEGIWQDAAGTLRGLRRSPAFTAGVMLTFALGIGANAAMFSLIDRLMLRSPAMLRDPASVHRVYLYKIRNGAERSTGGQYAMQADIARWTTAASATAQYAVRTLAVGTGQEAREQRIAVVSASFFGFFEAPPPLGRYFTAAEDVPPSGTPVVVLSHATWRAQFGGRTDILGAPIHIGRAIYTVIGVAPERFTGLWPLQPPAAFIPVAAFAATEAADAGWPHNYSWSFGLEGIVRRRPGVSVAELTASLTEALTRSFRAQNGLTAPEAEERIAALRPRAVAGPVMEERGPERTPVARVALWLGGVALIVLLIACANAASLLLARALGRRREIAVRLAIGVSRARLLSQLLTESLVLAVAGSVVGLAVGSWLDAVLRGAFLPDIEPVRLATDPRTLAFVGAIALAVGLATGILPMLQARRATLADDLKAGGRSGRHHRSPARAALLVLQGALSLVLLVGAALFVRSLRNVSRIDLGFDADSVLVVGAEMRDVRLDSAAAVALRQRLLAAAVTVPGVSHASFQLAVPFGGETSYIIFVDGVDSTDRFGQFDLNAVSPDYFATMGTRLLRGRGIEAGDVAGAPRVMVVGASMANVLWPGADAIGQCVRIRADSNPCTRVVGVAEDIHVHHIAPESRYFYYYLPASQLLPHEGGLFVRAAGDPRQLIEPLRQRLQREMPGASFVSVGRLAARVEDEARPWVMGATLFTAFGLLALALAAVGIYSVIAYDVAQRRRELAVRVALGASAATVLRLVVGEGIRYAAAGALAGSLVALAAAGQIAPLLFDQPARDPAVFAFVAGILVLVALGASAIPAWRGARVDPNAALRAE